MTTKTLFARAAVLAFALAVVSFTALPLALAGGVHLIEPSSGGGGASGTTGQIAFFDSDESVTSESSGFKWDATSNRLGIGDDTPDGVVDITQSTMTSAIPLLTLTGTYPAGAAAAQYGALLSVSTVGWTNQNFENAGIRVNYTGDGTATSGSGSASGWFESSARCSTNNYPGCAGVIARSTSSYFYSTGVYGYASGSGGAGGGNQTGVVGIAETAASGEVSAGIVGLNRGNGAGADYGGVFGLTENFPSFTDSTTDATLGLFRSSESGGFLIKGEDSGGRLTVVSGALALTNTSTGDAQVSFGTTAGTAKWSVGLDNSTSNDDFVIGTTALGTNNALSIDGSTRDVTIPNALTVSSTKSRGSCTLVSGTPSTCTATVLAGAICTCSPVGTTSAIAAGGCATSVSSTTLTITGPATVTTVVNYHCF